MIFITGGAHQGKLDYAKNNYKLSDSDIADCADMDTDKLDTDKLYEKRCITNLQLIARDSKDQTPKALEDFVSALISREQTTGIEYILIMDNVGSGIVPIKKEDRDYREAAGRLGCLIAESSRTVIRVICGIGQQIK